MLNLTEPANKNGLQIINGLALTRHGYTAMSFHDDLIAEGFDATQMSIIMKLIVNKKRVSSKFGGAEADCFSCRNRHQAAALETHTHR